MEKFLKFTTKETGESPPPPKRKREGSSVWQHFQKTAEKTKAICLHCGKILKTAGNTTNLSDHLKRIHPNVNTDETIDAKNLQLKRKSRLQEFTKEHKILLLQLVESKPVIWDTRDKKHYDAMYVKTAWEQVADNLNKEPDSCRLAWKSLRDSYKYICKTKKEKGIEVIDWEFAPYMAFYTVFTPKTQTFTPVFLADSQDQDLLYEDESCTVGSKKDSKDLDNSSFIYEDDKNAVKKQKLEEPSSSQQMVAMLSNFLQQQTTPSRPLLAYWESELNMMSPEDAEEVEQKMTKFLWAEKAALLAKDKIKQY